MLADLASWVVKVRYEDFPPHVIAKAKRLLLDTLGCAIGAIDGEPVRIAAEVVRQQGGNPQATVIGGGWKASAEQATFLNALAIRYLDFNDYAAFGYPHHPSINVGAALAIAEMQQLSGKDVLLGLTVAYEVHIRIRDFSADGKGNNGARKRGFDLPSIEAQFASAAAAGKLLRPRSDKLANALAIAGSFGNTLREVRSGGELAMAKGSAEAIASKNGIFAALLGRAGMSYPDTLLDGESGYAKVIVGDVDETDPPLAIDGFPHPQELLQDVAVDRHVTGADCRRPRAPQGRPGRRHRKHHGRPERFRLRPAARLPRGDQHP